MPSPFDNRLSASDNRVDHLRNAVDSGEERLKEPKRMTKQIEDTGKTMQELFTSNFNKPIPRKDESADHDTPGWIESLILLLKGVVRFFFPKAFPPVERVRTDLYVISENATLQKAWENRYDEMCIEAEKLDKATEATRDRCTEKQDEIEQLKQQLKTAREVVYFDPPDEERRRSFWERVLRALNAMRLSVFFDKYETIKHRHTDQMERLLDEPKPDTRDLQQHDKSAADCIEQCETMLDEIQQLAVPNHLGGNGTDA